jgi:hypothetical protein
VERAADRVSDTKACTQCGTSYPLTSEHWHKSKDGWHAKCRKCRNSVDKRGRDKKRQKKLAEIERGAVDYFLASARIGGANIPHSSELLEVLLRYFGGVEGFGRAFMKQIYDAPPGGAFRTKLLDSVLRLIVNNTAMGGSKKPLELMTEEELEAQYRRDVLAAALAYHQKLEVKNEMRSVPALPAGQGDEGSGGVPPVSAGGQPDPQGQGGDPAPHGVRLPDGVR